MKDKLKETIADIFAYLFKMERRTLLWTNSDPTATFVSQTISLDLSQYNAVDVEFVLFGGDTAIAFCGRNYNDGRYTIASGVASTSGSWYSGGSNMLVRGFRMSDTGVIIGEGRMCPTVYDSWQSGDHVLIPLRVYGIKVGGVLHSPLISRLTAILKIGGGVGERLGKRDVGEDTQTACGYYCAVCSAIWSRFKLCGIRRVLLSDAWQICEDSHRSEWLESKCSKLACRPTINSTIRLCICGRCRREHKHLLSRGNAEQRSYQLGNLIGCILLWSRLVLHPLTISERRWAV